MTMNRNKKKIDNVISLYLQNYLVYKSVGTYNFNKIHCSFIKKYLDSIKITYINQVNKHVIDNFIKYQKANNNKNSTINKRVGCIKRMIKYALDNDIISQKTYISLNLANVLPLKNTYKFIGFLNESETKLLINYILSLDITKKSCIKRKLIILLFLCSGLRLNELLNIKTDNIKIGSNSIYLEFTKNKVPRYLFFNDIVKAALLDYLKLYAKNEYLFYNEKTLLKLTNSAIECMFQRVSKSIGFVVSSHRLRHTFATTCLHNGIDIESLRILLGHSNIKTTQIYLHFDNETILKNYLKYNPLI